MKIGVLGLSHKTAPVALRERLSFAEADLKGYLAGLVGLNYVREGVILSTCNRVEIYHASHDPDAAWAETAAWLARGRGIDLAQLEPHLYGHTDEAAVRHGFRVASSLDSLVVGEPQILGQMKSAFQLASLAGTTGAILNRYFHRVFQVAKRVRSETAIAENPVSVASEAVELARKIFGGLENRVCLLIGAGEMCELAARHLVTHGVRQVLVTNRTLERAVRLAQEFDGHAFALETLGENLHRADIIISSTGASTYLLDGAGVRAALKQRRQQPMFFIDIAVPRDLDPEIGKIDNAFLYDIDDLNQIVDKNRTKRDQAALAAEKIVGEEVPEFLHWLQSLEVVPTIVALRERAEEIRLQEMEKLVAAWPGLTAEGRKRIEVLSRQMVNKILHPPTSRLRELAAQPEGDVYVDAARKLFNLD